MGINYLNCGAESSAEVKIMEENSSKVKREKIPIETQSSGLNGNIIECMVKSQNILFYANDITFFNL